MGILTDIWAEEIDALKAKVVELEAKLKHKDDEILRLHQLVNRPSRNHPSNVRFASLTHKKVGGIDWEE